MSLREVLHGLHWESHTTSVTTGTGSIVINILERPSWALIYMILWETGDELWEIGEVSDFEKTFLPTMPRNVILSSSGIGLLVNWPSGIKNVMFADSIPDSLVRYVKRVIDQECMSARDKMTTSLKCRYILNKMKEVNQ